MGISKKLGFCILLLGAVSIGSSADAITYGVPDNGAHPNVVSIAGFRETPTGELISSGRCSGSLIRKEEKMLVFLTAGHCPQFWLEGLQNGSLVDVGVSFHGFMGPKRNLMRAFQHFAKDQNGSCGGDSGGPNFLDIGGAETQVSVISSGSFPCNSTSITARLDIPEAMDFVDCALTDPDPTFCGCVEVDKHGMCP